MEDSALLTSIFKDIYNVVLS